MSKYHSNCCPKINDCQKEKRKGPPLTSKPFCDCETCKCKDCPDILKLLSITVTEDSCDFGPKKTDFDDFEQQLKGMDELEKVEDCGKIMARTVGFDVGMSINIAKPVQTAKTNQQNSSTTKASSPKK